MICPYLSGVDLDGQLVKVECLKHECAKYVHVLGKNPQTGVDVDEWNCSDAWLPILMIESTQKQRQTTAAVESFRNEMKSDNQALLGAGYVPIS